MASDQVTIPPELESLLLEYTLNAIVENPQDLVSHAADYFTKLRDKRETDINIADEGSKEFISQIVGGQPKRRGSVFGESFDPEQSDDEEDSKEEVQPKTDEQRQRIKDRTADVFLFRVLDSEDISAVIDVMIPKEVKEGDVVIKQGDDGDFFYLIDKGNFDIIIKNENEEEKKVGTYNNKGFFGELALLHNQPRAATIIAKSDGFLWAVGRKTFNRLIVKRAFEKRQMYMKLLDEVNELKPLTEYEKMQIADALIPKSYSEGDVVVTEGEEGDGMYFIVEGKVSVRQKKAKDETTKDVEVSQLGKNDFFGGEH